jgi:Protein of unknown function (DUF2905)
MLKWFLTLVITVIVFSFLWPRLAAWFRMGRLPGDVTVRLRGRVYPLPFATALAFSLIAALIGRFI